MNNTNDIDLLHRIMQNENIVLTYAGNISQEIVKSMLKYTESKLEHSGVKDLVRKKIFNVMMEMLQNISKHLQRQCEMNENAIFILGELKDGFYLMTANEIENANIDGLKEKISYINSLNKEELKELYKKTRLNSTISEVGGAGLGFIDMVRKSDNPLEFDFVGRGEKSSYFVLKAIIKNNENE